MPPTPTRRQSTHAAYLACRTIGHAWEQVPAEAAGTHGGDPMWLSCMRCTAQRHDSVSRATGDLMSRQYVYPEGYQHAFDTQFADAAPTRNDFRRMLLAEVLSKRPFGRRAVAA